MNGLHASKRSSSDRCDYRVNVNNVPVSVSSDLFMCSKEKKKKKITSHDVFEPLTLMTVILKVISVGWMLFCVCVWITEYKRRNLFCISCQNTLIFNMPRSCLWKINLQKISPLQSFTEGCYSQILMHINTSEFVQYSATLSALPVGFPFLYRLDNAWVAINSRK